MGAAVGAGVGVGVGEKGGTAEATWLNKSRYINEQRLEGLREMRALESKIRASKSVETSKAKARDVMLGTAGHMCLSMDSFFGGSKQVRGCRAGW